MSKHKIFGMTFRTLFDCYVKKIEKKGRQVSELRDVMMWFMDVSDKKLDELLTSELTLEEVLQHSEDFNPKRLYITGVVCGIRVEEVTDPMMREVRYLDKVVDELAKGRSMEKILRK